MGPWLQPSHGGIPGSRAHKGSFLPLPQHGRIRPKHSISFCGRWPRSSLARCQLPGHSVSPRGSAGSGSPLPNTGGLCGAEGLNGGSVWPGMPRGREVEPLVSSVYLEVEIMARLGCRSGGTFMPALTGWEGRAAPVPCSSTTLGTQQGLGSASLPPCACTVLNPPARCSWRARAWGGVWG